MGENPEPRAYQALKEPVDHPSGCAEKGIRDCWNEANSNEEKNTGHQKVAEEVPEKPQNRGFEAVRWNALSKDLYIGYLYRIKDLKSALILNGARGKI
jgi:hypothetical protein